MEMFQRFALLCLCIFHLAALVCAQDQAGFISLDCGLPKDSSYTETSTKLRYTSDANYIETGLPKSILLQYRRMKQQQVWSLRSFPDGIRNCYRFNLTRNTKYLIRATFMYGNYDEQNNLPEFDVHLGPNLWGTIKIENVSVDYSVEIIHLLSSDYLSVCLVNTNKGTPFISALELRPLDNNTYITQTGSLELSIRLDVGSTSNATFRYIDDAYDRVWWPYDLDEWEPFSTSEAVDADGSKNFKPPPRAMKSAVRPVHASNSLDFSINASDPTSQLYVYMHFAEIEELKANESRLFNITRNGNLWYGPLKLNYLSSTTVFSQSAMSGGQYNFSLIKTGNSTHPPIINAIEIYKVKEFSQSQTDEQDVDAIMNIKSFYGLKKNWQGDPCAPQDYLWEGLNCSYPDDDSPRITSLNLSASGLTGGFAHYLTNLTMLTYLDLSNNNLTGPVPKFLSQLSSLKFLNLARNKLTGPLPVELLEKQENNTLELRFDGNPDLCRSASCKKEKKKFVVPVVASVASVFVVLAALIGLWSLKRKKQLPDPQILIWLVRLSSGRKVDANRNRSYESLDQSSRQFTYSEVLRMTNNFERVLGKGGFGTVYHGKLDNDEVAVKMLSPSSSQGYKQFQAEVKLLLRVHHRNLTTLVGYCDEGTNMALIYEYMANGNLEEHLSDSSKEILNWEERLRIAVEAALGLEYLHQGCKPPIVHRDVKSTNILINEKFQAKLADFGLSRVFPVEGGTHVSTTIAGTPGYLDPEYYISNRLTEKSDVYSFGVVLLEIITGHPVISKSAENGHTHVAQWVSSMLDRGDIRSTVDPRLKGDFDINSVWKAVEIAMACVSSNANRRPFMNQVVMELNDCLAMEAAQKKESITTSDSNNSVEMITVNLHTELSPLAR
ncbi:hypothetical protein AB3S75_001386 [Citrus x aurantiifolia]